MDECSLRVLIRFPLDTLHIMIVLSPDPDAKYSPLGEKITLLTVDDWSVRVLIRSPLDTLHIPIVSSTDPDAKKFPFGENTTL